MSIRSASFHRFPTTIPPDPVRLHYRDRATSLMLEQNGPFSHSAARRKYIYHRLSHPQHYRRRHKKLQGQQQKTKLAFARAFSFSSRVRSVLSPSGGLVSWFLPPLAVASFPSKRNRQFSDPVAPCSEEAGLFFFCAGAFIFFHLPPTRATLTAVAAFLLQRAIALLRVYTQRNRSLKMKKTITKKKRL